MIGEVIGGLTGIASGMIGSGKRKREQRAAQADYDRRKADYENTDTSNVYANMENTMEDLTVNQDQAKFQTEQSQQGLSNIMGSMQGAAGGSGGSYGSGGAAGVVFLACAGLPQEVRGPP